MRAAAASLAGPLLRLNENPILVAQVRRRLRRRRALPILVLMGLVGISAVLFGAVSPEPEVWLVVRTSLLLLFGLVLLAKGMPQVSGMVDDDRSEGLLDFHRATPTPPWMDCIGYTLGCASREYAMAGVLLPFLVVAHLGAGGSLTALVLGLAVLLSSAVLLHSFGVLTGLRGGGLLPFRTGRKARQTSVAVLVLLFWVSSTQFTTGQSWLLAAHLTPLPGLAHLGFFGPEAARAVQTSFFGAATSPLLFTFCVQGLLVGFLAWANTRKLQREDAHAFTRPGALAFLGLLSVLVIGAAWERLRAGGAAAGIGVGAYLLAGLALASALGLSLVPTRLEQVRAVRRARRAATRVPLLATGAPAWSLVPLFLAVLLAGSLLVSSAAAGDSGAALRAHLSARGLLAFASVAAFLAVLLGLVERNRLTFGAAWRGPTFLQGFLIFVLPWLAGGILKAGGFEVENAAYVWAFSPFLGAGTSIVLFAASLGAELPEDLQTRHALVSLAVASILGVLLFLRGAAERRRLEDAEADAQLPGTR